MQCCQCFNCKHWIHYECTRLPKYTLASPENFQQRYSCEECEDIPEEFWEGDISLNPSGKRTNEEPNIRMKKKIILLLSACYCN